MGNGTGPVPATVVDDGLGNTCYVLDLGDGGALVVDPSRDLRSVRAAAEKAGLRIRFVADTHLHADFLSGAVQLAHDDGAEVLASAAGHREFGHRGLVDGDQVDLEWTGACSDGHARTHRRAPVVRAVRRQLAARRVHRRLSDRRFRCADGPARGRPGRGARPCPVPLASAARHVAGRDRCVANPRRRFVLLRSAGSGPHLDDRPGAGDEPAAAGTRQRRLHQELLGSLGSYPPYFRRLAEINRRGPGILDNRPRRPARSTTGARLFNACAPMAPSLSMSGRSPTRPPNTSRGPCPSRCAPSSRRGWAGSPPSTTR